MWISVNINYLLDVNNDFYTPEMTNNIIHKLITALSSENCVTTNYTGL